MNIAIWKLNISGSDSQVVPPVPIPNTVVKHLNVESTWVATPWEDRKLPVHMVAVVKRLTHWIVAPACVGSIPTSHPIFTALFDLFGA